MKTKLKSGQEVFVKTHYNNDDTLEHKGEVKHCRSTEISLTIGEDTYTGKSICSPLDQFCRRTGRRLAANRLLKSMKDANVSKQIRKEAFQAICPEFAESPLSVS